MDFDRPDFQSMSGHASKFSTHLTCRLTVCVCGWLMERQLQAAPSTSGVPCPVALLGSCDALLSQVSQSAARLDTGLELRKALQLGTYLRCVLQAHLDIQQEDHACESRALVRNLWQALSIPAALAAWKWQDTAQEQQWLWAALRRLPTVCHRHAKCFGLTSPTPPLLASCRTGACLLPHHGPHRLRDLCVRDGGDST